MRNRYIVHRQKAYAIAHEDDTIPYGVPEENKFPLDTRAHVLSAIKFFNWVKPQYERELARKIIAKIRQYNISSLTPSDQNRFYKYYTPKKQ